MAHGGSGAALRSVAVVVGLVIAGCSDGDATTRPTTDPTTDPALIACAPVEPVLQVDQVDEAVAALEAELDGGQQYFEINATPQIVNLFVSSADGTEVVPYAWIGGELTASDASPAQGNTFPSTVLSFDPALVTACVSDQLPGSQQDVFVVEGGAGGAVRYSVVVTSAQGGQLVVEVAGNGQVIAVDPV